MKILIYCIHLLIKYKLNIDPCLGATIGEFSCDGGAVVTVGVGGSGGGGGEDVDDEEVSFMSI